MITLFDIIFIAAALLLLFFGMIKLKKKRTTGRRESVSFDAKGLIRYLFTHHRILENPLPGRFHLFLFYGFCLFALVTVFVQFGIALPLSLSRGISFVLDIAGTLMLCSTLFFIFRHFSSPQKQQKSSKLFTLFLIFSIVLAGFLAAGCRISLLNEPFSIVSPVGWFFSLFMADSPHLMQVMIRLHFFFVLLFIALIPFSFMRHIPLGIKNVYTNRLTKIGDLRHIDFHTLPLGAASLADFSDKQVLDAQACSECGRCTDHCPAAISQKPLNPQAVVSALFTDTVHHITPDEIWSCTTCMACITHCPVLIDPMDKIMALRRNQVLDRGQLPAEARPMIRNLELFGDTYGKGASHRTDWFQGSISMHRGKADILLWIGCSGAFHPRYNDVANAMSGLLTLAGISFAILGEKEVCCGDGVRRLGEESLFQTLAKQNIEAINTVAPEKIIAFCPHCFNTLKNEYPKMGGRFNVVSSVEFLANLVNEKKLVPRFAANKTITLHDPCYLGRANGIYDPLRSLMQAIPGLFIKEMDRSRDTALCCGGGGGRMWLHETLGENINQIRSREVLDTGADIVGTACPFCMAMMEDGIGSFESDQPPAVLDLIEIVAQSMGLLRKGVS